MRIVCGLILLTSYNVVSRLNGVDTRSTMFMRNTGLGCFNMLDTIVTEVGKEEAVL